MPTKHQLQQQLEETREDLEAERSRADGNWQKARELERELREARTDLERMTKRANDTTDRLLAAEAEASRLRGHLEGMRYMIRLEKGLEPHEDPVDPPRACDTMGDFYSRAAGR